MELPAAERGAVGHPISCRPPPSPAAARLGRLTPPPGAPRPPSLPGEVVGGRQRTAARPPAPPPPVPMPRLPPKPLPRPAQRSLPSLPPQP
eukprot:scaffold7994_cov57-Phaeocystis_antarctica.AAC.2